MDASRDLAATVTDDPLAENARLADELRQAVADLAAVRARGAGPRVAFDFRLVLENPDFGWPEDMLAQARALRDAAMASLRPCYAVRRRGSQHVRVLTPDMLARFFDNRDPGAWTDPVPLCATGWVS